MGSKNYFLPWSKDIFSLGGKIHFLKVAKHIFSWWQNIFSHGAKIYFLMWQNIFSQSVKTNLLMVAKYIFSKCQNIFSLSAKTYLLMVAKGVLLSVPPDGGRVSADRETGQSDNLLRVAISLRRTYRVSFLKVPATSDLDPLYFEVRILTIVTNFFELKFLYILTLNCDVYRSKDIRFVAST